MRPNRQKFQNIIAIRAQISRCRYTPKPANQIGCRIRLQNVAEKNPRDIRISTWNFISRKSEVHRGTCAGRFTFGAIDSAISDGVLDK